MLPPASSPARQLAGRPKLDRATPEPCSSRPLASSSSSALPLLLHSLYFEEQKISEDSKLVVISTAICNGIPIFSPRETSYA